MQETLDEQLKRVLWADFRPEDSFPAARPLLAHYTSMTTLGSIIESNQIWFSNPLLMNDHEELKFGINAGAQRLRENPRVIKACESNENHEKLIQSLESLYSYYEQNHVFDTYVLCFSEHDPKDNDGVLSMWRGYGESGNGVALVIDTSKIDPINNSPLVIAKVEYATQKDRFNWIDEKIKRIADVIEKNPKTEDNLYAIAHHWLERLKMFALFSKHIGFSEEREWRIVYIRERDKNKALDEMLKYKITSKGVEPKLKLDLKHIPDVTSESFDLDTITDRLILGPSLSTTMSAMSFQRMLKVQQQHGLAKKVAASGIPFRT